MIIPDTPYRGLAFIVAGVVVAAAVGCIWDEERRDKMALGVDAVPGSLAESAAFKDTIGAMTLYEGMTPLRVRGIGLVVGLGTNGSTDCPRSTYDTLVQSMYKEHSFTSSTVGSKSISPERLIADKDTAVVMVQGEVPPAAVAGDRFDISVSAWPGTQTKSLRGGRLYTVDLDIFRQVNEGQSISGQTVARAAGPLFINPFVDDESATKSNELQGIVLGGGMVTQDRRVRLVLLQPSYQWATRIQDRINDFSPDAKKIARAETPSFVSVRIPREFQGDAGHFLSLVQSLFLFRDPRFGATRAKELTEELLDPGSPHAKIALALEGLGRYALPELDKLYKHPRDDVSFHAAVAGLRLEDHVAGDAMIRHAENPRGSFRMRAVRALGKTRGMGQATIALRRLLDDDDPRIQTAAYEALIQRHDPSIESTVIGGDNFRLDVIPSERPAFVYAKRRSERRLAIFGSNLPIRPPVLYRSPDGGLMVTASPDDTVLSIIRTVVATGSSSPPIRVSADVTSLATLLGHDADVDYTDAVTGMSVDYGEVVRLLYHLCEDGAIDANFLLERPHEAELIGPAERDGRRESEL